MVEDDVSTECDGDKALGWENESDFLIISRQNRK